MGKGTFKCSLWFNDSKQNMKQKLFDGEHNSGVGIHIGKNAAFLKNYPDHVRLKFDDGTEGVAIVEKDSFSKCTHIIQESIGLWARRNGLWERKLNERTVLVTLKVSISYEELFVMK